MSISSVAADRRAFPALTALLAAGLVGPTLVVALAATGVPPTAAAIGLVVVAAGLLWRPTVRSTLVQLRLALGTPIALLFILGLTIASCYTVRLSGFMLDATRADLSVFPKRKFFREHACLTSYTEAAGFAAEGLNIYEVQRYVDIPKPGEYKDRYIGPISVDIYQYPPTFLVLPYPAFAAGLDFFTIRRIWFFIQTTVFFAGVVLLARWISGPAAIAALLLMPLLWIAPTTRLTLQVGNFQLFAFATAMLAMIAFDRGRNVTGGLGLGFVSAAKIFPGVLGLILLVNRQWKAVLSTIGWSLALTLLAWMMIGSKPFTDFVTFQMPRIQSGEAFFWIEEDPNSPPINGSVYGLVTKLRALGLPMTGQLAANRASSAYALVVFLIAGLAAWRLSKLGSTGITSDALRMRQAQVWLALLSLTSFRSPFVPDAYGLIGTIWLLTLIAAERRWRGYMWVLFGSAMAAFSMVFDGSLPRPLPTWILLLTLAIQLAAIGLNVAVAIGAAEGSTLASERPDPSRLPTRDVEFRVP